MPSKIYEICNSYESGYGHGLQNDGFDLSKTPHSDAELGEAYQVGYAAGLEKWKKLNEVKDIIRLCHPGMFDDFGDDETIWGYDGECI